MKLKEQSGQMIVESILLMTIMVGFAYFITSYFRSNDIIARLVSSPWTNLAGVIQNGTWAPPEQNMTTHPNDMDRRLSLEGDPPR